MNVDIWESIKEKIYAILLLVSISLTSVNNFEAVLANLILELFGDDN